MRTLLRPVPLVLPRRGLWLGQSENTVERLRHDGAIVTVQITRPAASGGGGPMQTVKAMVDTGASISTVSDAIASAAGLQATSSAPIGGVGGTSERPIYAASMTLPEYNVTVDPIEVAGVTIPMPGIDMLVGRDVLRALRLDYRGPAGAFALTQEGSKEPLPSRASSGGGATETILGVGAAAALIGALVLFKAF